MSPFVRYTLLRLGVLAGVGALLWLVGLRGPLWALAAVVVAAAVSYLVLTGPREEVLARWGQRSAGGRVPSDEEVEDADPGADPAEGDRRA